MDPVESKGQPTLEEVGQQFKRWRRSKSRRDRIPPALWSAAVSLFGRHSAYQIAKYLHLNPTDLKDHIHAKRVPEGPKGFIDLGLLPTRGENPVEMICLRGSGLDVAELCKAFFGAGR
jgi:hypothetical protein